MNKYLGWKVPKCGAMDSKYFGKPQQFEIDMQKHAYETEQFKEELKALIASNPNKVKDRYNQAISVMLDIKQEYGL